MNNNSKIEPIVLLLFIGMLVWSALLFVCQQYYSDDGQIFQVISGLLTGFSGAFFMRIKPRGVDIENLRPPSEVETKTTIEVKREPGKPAE